MSEVTLSANLQYLMKIHGGLSVSELARQTQVPQPTLHHILSGTTKNPRKEALASLASFFSISIAQLTGTLPLLSTIPDTIKRSLKLSTIPFIEWEAVKTWPVGKTISTDFKEIILDRVVHENSFALVMPDTSLEPIFPEKSLLIFDPSKKPKDRDFGIVHFSHNDNIMFNRLFMEGSECYIKQAQHDGNAQLVKIKPSVDKIIATLIEVRLQF